MTIASTLNRIVYTGAGLAGPFGTGFKYINNADVKVIKTLLSTSVGTTLVENVDYTLVQDLTTLQGTVTLTVAIDATYKLTIYRDPAVLQGTAFPPNDKFPAKANENAVDLLTMIAQRFLDVFARSARLSDSDVSGADPMLPTPVAGSLLGWKADLTGLQNYISAGVFAISAYGQTLINAANAAAARGLLLITTAADQLLVNLTITTKGDIITATAANTVGRKGVGTDGFSLMAQTGAADGLQYLPPDQGFSLINGYLDWTVAGNALTVAIKGWDGNDPSATNPVYAILRDVTATVGLPTLVKITAANSVVVSSGSTLGTRSAIPCRVWAVLFNDAGTYRLGVINCLTTVAGVGAGSDVTAIYPLVGWGIASSTAEGGAGAADNAQTFYTGVAVAAKAYTVLGYATFEAGQAAAGTWATAASRKQLWGQSVPLPGAVIQTQRTPSGAVVTGTTTIPIDDTIPQNTEGDQYLSQAITPSSAANVLAIEAQLCISNNAATGTMIAACFQDATANALTAATLYSPTATAMMMVTLFHRILSAVTAATTLKIRAGANAAGTTTFNGGSSARLMGGVANSYLQVAEIMA